MYILNKNLEKIYNEYGKIKKNKQLQIVEKNDDIYILGIPYQRDIKEILDELM